MTKENDINSTTEFKPGNSVSLPLDNEILNNHINWRKTLLQIMLYKDCGLAEIANVVSCAESALLLILKQNDAGLLGFKQGARLLSLHDVVLPNDIWLRVNKQ